MQHIDLNAAKAAKATDRRALAILAYDNATADPAGANWRGVAELLRLALPAVKAKAAETAADSRFAPWADYPIPQNASGKRLGKSPVVIVSFADGETVRVPAVSLPGKPVNIGRALRVAVAFYQGRMAGRAGKSVTDSAFVAGLTIPAVASAVCETTGAEYEPGQCAAHVAASVPTVAPSVEGQTEYGDADKVAVWGWLQSRRGIFAGLMTATGDEFISGERTQRLAYAVMTLWPDLADPELEATESPATANLRTASRFLASTSIARDIPGLPVAPAPVSKPRGRSRFRRAA